MATIDRLIKSHEQLNRIDIRITNFLNMYGMILLRYSLGITFIWFGALKPFRLSPADDLVAKTIVFLPADIFVPILGIWEMVIGITLIVRKWNRIAIFLLFAQMGGTFLPLILLPEVCFQTFPFVLTLEGQYIIKNIVLISAGIVIGGSVRDFSEERIH